MVSLSCVLEQDTLILAKYVLVEPRNILLDITEKLLTGTLLCLFLTPTSHQQLRSYGDGATTESLIRQTGEAGDPTCDPWFTRQVAYPLHHSFSFDWDVKNQIKQRDQTNKAVAGSYSQ